MSYVKRPLGDEAAPKISIDPKPIAGAALVYHGYRRTGSLFWAAIYGLAGYTAPIVAVPVALAQGFGTRRVCTTED